MRDLAELLADALYLAASAVVASGLCWALCTGFLRSIDLLAGTP